MGKLRASWVFLIGVLIIAYGFYKLYELGFPFTEPSGEYSEIFQIMFLGLAVSGVGAAYGKRRLRREYESVVSTASIESPKAPEKEIKEAPKEEEKKPVKAPGRQDIAVCSKCGEENPKKAKFCEECGAKLVSKCPKCGEENKPSAKFCEECGNKL